MAVAPGVESWILEPNVPGSNLASLHALFFILEKNVAKIWHRLEASEWLPHYESWFPGKVIVKISYLKLSSIT